MEKTVATQEQTTATVQPETLWNKIERVNAILLSQEPANISIDSFANATGYDFQAIKNAMNRVFTPDGWGYDEVSHEIFYDGEKPNLVVTEVKVWIEGSKKEVKAWGQCNITRGAVGDALKGGKTDGAKKGLSDYSIGDRAYLGLLSRADAEEYAKQQEAAAKQKQLDARNRANAAARAAQNGNTENRAAAPTEERREQTPRQQERPAGAARPAQAASAAPAPRQASARQEPRAAAPAPLNTLPAPASADEAPTWASMVKRYTALDVHSKGKRVTWIEFLERVFRDELATNQGLMKIFLDSTKQESIDAGLRLKLHGAIKEIEDKRAAAAAARS